MLTKMSVRNFKLFQEEEIPLGNGFVFIGQNNSGKTSALQALALWYIGLQKWNSRRTAGGKKKEGAERRYGVRINRRDVLPLPMSHVNLLWYDCQVRRGHENVLIDIIVHGISTGKEWKCGLEFGHSDPDSFFCRPQRLPSLPAEGTLQGESSSAPIPRMIVPQEAINAKVAFLPPMSGLASVEPFIQPGRINVLLGEGRTAEVLRNLCHTLASQEVEKWNDLVFHINRLFGVTLRMPDLQKDRGEIVMGYTEKNRNAVLDLQSAGRGMQQVMLLLAFLYTHPKTTLLLDEPDAHLEILRQRQIYHTLNEIAESQQSQVIAASHSEVLLNESARRQSAVAFVGKPHILGDNQQSQALKALETIGYEYYYLAEMKGWMLYLESESDLEILRALARRLNHDVADELAEPPIKYLGSNLPQIARDHFFGLREAKSDLVGVMLVDHVSRRLKDRSPLKEMMWQQREIENYLCHREAILAFIVDDLPDDLWGLYDASSRRRVMDEEIQKLTDALEVTNRPHPFSSEIKSSDDFLMPLFRNYAKATKTPRVLEKRDYYKLVEYIPPDQISSEVTMKLDAIYDVVQYAKPRRR